MRCEEVRGGARRCNEAAEACNVITRVPRRSFDGCQGKIYNVGEFKKSGKGNLEAAIKNVRVKMRGGLTWGYEGIPYILGVAAAGEVRSNALALFFSWLCCALCSCVGFFLSS